MGEIVKIWDSKNKRAISVEIISRSGNECMALCPFHNDTNPSLSVNPVKGVYYCHSCGAKGVLYDPNYPKSKMDKDIYNTYVYKDYKSGEIIQHSQMIKYEDGDYSARRPDGKGGRIYSLKEITKIPYRLPEIIKSAQDNEVILFLEGEKDVDNAIKKLKVIATTTPNGSKGWKDDYKKYFEKRDIVLCPDNDMAGKKYMLKVGKSLLTVDCRIKYLELPRLEERQDLTDWLDKGGTKKELIELVKRAPYFDDIFEELEIILNGKFSARYYALNILSKHNIKYDEFKRLCLYDKNQGIWILYADSDLKSILRKEILYNEHLKTFYINEVIEETKDYVFRRGENKKPPAYLIPFNDKIYDLENDRLIDYSPDYFFINKIPYNINTENKDCPTIDRIFEQLVGEENKHILYEIAAYGTYRSYPYQKFFMIYGDGENGKTTYINILIRFFGEDNISTFSFKDIQRSRFGFDQLHGKFLNISDEIDQNVIKNTGRLKQATGGNLITTDKKFKAPFQFRNYAKIIIVINKIPKTLDNSDAFYRRVFLLLFPNKFESGKNAKQNIWDDIPEKEFDGFAYKLIDVLKDLKERKFVFEENTDTESIRARYDKLSNPLVNFLKDLTVSDSSGYISNPELQEKFNTYLSDRGIDKWTPKEIGSSMAKLQYVQNTISKKNTSGQNSTERAWMGIRWK